MKTPFRNLKTRVFIHLGISVGLLLVFLTVIFYIYYRREQSSQVRNRLAGLAATAALILDPSRHQEIARNGREDSAAYREEALKLGAFLEGNRDIRFIYTMALKNGRIVFILDPTPPGDADGDGVNDHAALGQEYSEGPARDILKAFAGDTVFTSYTDRWGSFLSVFVPLRHGGEITGVVGLDMNLRDIARLERGLIVRLAIIFVTAAAVIIFLSYIITSLFMKPVLNLGENVTNLPPFGARPIDTSALLGELRPFADKINQYLQRVNEELAARESAEMALAASERRFRELTDLLPQIVFEADTKGMLTFVNTTGLRIFGYTRDDIASGIQALDIIVPEDRERAALNIAGVIEKGASTSANEYRLMRSDGSLIPVLIYSTPVITDGNTTGFRGIMVDITDRKKAEEDLRQAQKMEILGNLAGGIAHDFNNILAVILGTVSLLKFSLDGAAIDPEKLKDDIAMIESAATRASNLVKQLLTLSKKQEISMGPADLRDIVEKVILICRATMSRGIEIVLKGDTGITPVRADITQLEQALLNLCINASHAVQDAQVSVSGRKGRIELTLESKEIEGSDDARRGTYWLVTIADNGTGIPARIREKIFEPFFTTRETGTGLGLTMARSIITSHGGFVDLRSEEGKGTVFSIYLPKLDADGYRPAGPAQDAAPSRGTGTILVVDDEEMIRSTAGRILASCGYRVITAGNGEEALAALRENANGIDGVLLDLEMPGISGLEVYGKIRENALRVKVIMMSGHRRDIRVEKAMELGANGFIQKPFTLAELADKVHRVLTG